MIELCNAALPQLFDHGRHFILIEALAGIAVKMDAQQIIYRAHFLERKVLHALPKGNRLRIALLDFMEPGPRRIVERAVLIWACSFLLFRLLVETDVELHKFAHAGFFNRPAFAPLFIGDDHLSKLRAPIAQVVDGDGVISQELIDPVEGIANRSAGQVADVERLCNVDGGKLHAYVFAAALIGRAIALTLRKHAL